MSPRGSRHDGGLSPTRQLRSVWSRSGPRILSGAAGAFEKWDRVLGDDAIAAALIDRLLHHCHIVNIGGNSYRMWENQVWLQVAS